MIILRLLLLLTNLHLKLLSIQGTGADKLLSTQRVNILQLWYAALQLRHFTAFVTKLANYDYPVAGRGCVILVLLG